MPFNVKKRGKLTYYYEGDDPVLSSLVVETQPDGDLRICFAGLTGGYSATGVLGLDTVARMQQAGLCATIAEVDFIEIHAFGCQPKSPNPLVDPVGYAKEIERLPSAYAKAYRGYFKGHCPDNGLPARFTVHVVDVPDQAASYEFYGVGLVQKSLRT